MKTIQFRDFIILQRGFDLPKHSRDEGEYPVIAATGIHGSHSEFKVNPPGVVTGRSGSLGEVVFVERPYWPLNTTLWVKDFKGNEPRYVYYFLKTLDLKRFNSGAGVPTLNRNHLDTLVVKIHDRQNQQKIAAILSAYDDLIENNVRRIKILEEIVQTIYREWFVKFRFPGHQKVKMVNSPLGKIPEGWEVRSFTDIADVLSGGTPKTSVREYWGGDIPFFAPKDAPRHFYVTQTENAITQAGLEKCNSRLYPKDTVFITARGTVGKVVLTGRNMAMNQSCYALAGKKGISHAFLFFHTLQYVNQLRKRTGGATFETIIVDTFRQLKVILPPPNLINQFTEMIHPSLDLMLNLILGNQLLRQTRDLLLPKLISGEVDVSELDITIPEANA